MTILEILEESLKRKEQEVEEIRKAISAIYTERSKDCTHPDLEVTPYEKYCPYCSWHKDRSF